MNQYGSYVAEQNKFASFDSFPGVSEYIQVLFILIKKISSECFQNHDVRNCRITKLKFSECNNLVINFSDRKNADGLGRNTATSNEELFIECKEETAHFLESTLKLSFERSKEKYISTGYLST